MTYIWYTREFDRVASIAAVDPNGTPPLNFDSSIEVRIVDSFSSAGSTAAFIRGDSSADGVFDLSDPIQTLQMLFGIRDLDCDAAADVDSDDDVDLDDVLFALQTLFLGGPAPASPYPGCGSASASLPCSTAQCP